MSWTPERIETLERLWKDGLSCSQIAKALGGVTRNAVIGKASRMGLTGRPAPSKPKSFVWTDDRVEKLKSLAGTMPPDQISREMGIPITKIYDKGKRMGLALRVKPKPVEPSPAKVTARMPTAIMDEPEIDPNARGLLVTEMPAIGRCRFPKSGSSYAMRMCGEPTVPDTATYCPACARRAYQPARKVA